MEELLAVPADRLGDIDLARLNLLCAIGLPGAEKLNVSALCAELDRWVERVRSETDRMAGRPHDAPKGLEGSDAFFRMCMLITVLQQDFGVHYNMERVREIDFRNSQDLFIHGMVGGKNGGTCVSMPYLYMAVAHRLGYPVYLVRTRQHVFCRWDGWYRGRHERMNIEGAGIGINVHPDNYYIEWPHRISPAEAESYGYLRNLSLTEVLAGCLATRGWCVEDLGRLREAAGLYEKAIQLSPRSLEYRAFYRNCVKKTLARRPVGVVQSPPSNGDSERFDSWNRQQMRRITPQPTEK
jgi:hypothetical protein